MASSRVIDFPVETRRQYDQREQSYVNMHNVPLYTKLNASDGTYVRQCTLVPPATTTSSAEMSGGGGGSSSSETVRVQHNKQEEESAEERSLVCWWDMHRFDGPPFYMPTRYQKHGNILWVTGRFCSLHCVRAHIESEPNPGRRTRLCDLFRLMCVLFYGGGGAHLPARALPRELLNTMTLNGMPIDEWRAACSATATSDRQQPAIHRVTKTTSPSAMIFRAPPDLFASLAVSAPSSTNRAINNLKRKRHGAPLDENGEQLPRGHRVYSRKKHSVTPVNRKAQTTADGNIDSHYDDDDDDDARPRVPPDPVAPGVTTTKKKTYAMQRPKSAQASCRRQQNPLMAFIKPPPPNDDNNDSTPPQSR